MPCLSVSCRVSGAVRSRPHDCLHLACGCRAALRLWEGVVSQPACWHGVTVGRQWHFPGLVRSDVDVSLRVTSHASHIRAVRAVQVYKGIDQSTGGVVAIKEISLEGMSADDLDGLQTEVDLLKGLNHRNVVQYLGTFKVRTRAAHACSKVPHFSLHTLESPE